VTVVQACLAVAIVPLLGLVLLEGTRHPVRGPLTAYAAVLPFGSALSLPVPGVPSPFRTLSSALGLLALATCLLHVLLQGTSPGRLRPVLGAALLVPAVALGSWAWSVDPSATASAVPALLAVVALFVVTCLVVPEPGDLNRLYVAVVLGGAGTGLYAFGQALTGSLPAPDGGAPRFATAGGGGEGADPNSTAASLLLPLVLALSGILRARRTPTRLLAALAALCVATGIVLTGSRGGLLAVGAALIVLVWQLRGAAWAAGALTAGCVVLLLAATTLPAATGARLSSVSSSGRAQVWEVGLRTCEHSCLLGTGWSTFPTDYRNTLLTAPDLAGHGTLSYRAHNMWLALLVEVGVVGVLVMALLVALLLREVRRLGRSTRGPLLAALAALLTANLLLSNASFKYFWLVPMVVVLEISTARTRTAGARA
jgi:O-antigen ligase